MIVNPVLPPFESYFFSQSGFESRPSSLISGSKSCLTLRFLAFIGRVATGALVVLARSTINREKSNNNRYRYTNPP